MQRLTILLVICATLGATSGCATKRYVRDTVSTSADQLSARIDSNENEMKEIRDGLDKKVTAVDGRVTTVDGRVTAVDSKVTALDQKADGINKSVQTVSNSAADARKTADRAVSDVGTLNTKFQNRNNFNVSGEKVIQFKFDSAKLDKDTSALDEIAATLMQNPDAIVVLEGRTDSTGNKDYNVRLGERRIEAVRRYLAVEKGVPVFRIHEISFGSEKPIAENNTRDGREKNRAVTLTIMVPKTDAVASRNED